ncbi:uncharacterized protein LOC142170711 [Nicotiana tabacum]|uniref:Uncharacterized protein LOC142170711 n=1 Tax=Nicotiana tabacum TaxID=4097 RepID=A0AC58SVR1_TOBAC
MDGTKTTKKCIFIGYIPQSKAYRRYNPTNGKVIINKSVVFNEEATWELNDKKEDSSVDIPFHTDVEHMEIVESGSLDPSSPGSSNTDFSSHGSTKNSTPASSHSPTSASSSETPAKFRSLKDVYSACSFALSELLIQCVMKKLQSNQSGRMQ